jgi:hypothetical protein
MKFFRKRLTEEARSGVGWALKELLRRLEVDAIASNSPEYFLIKTRKEADIDFVKRLMEEVNPTKMECPICGPQPLENFYLQRRTKYGDYLQTYCKHCSTARKRAERAKKKEANR